MKTNTLDTVKIAEPRAPYYCLSLPAWRQLAAEAIGQGQSESEFLARWHGDNQSNARTAYRVERAAIARAEGSKGGSES